MKKIVSLLVVISLMVVAEIHAQPNITDSIYRFNKICHANEQYSYLYTTKTGAHYTLKQVMNSSNLDARLYKLNAQFDTIWSVQYGGSDYDHLFKMGELQDGSLILVGTAQSKDGTLQGIMPMNYGRAMWVLKVDTTGAIIQQKVIGGIGSADYACMYISEWDDIYIGGNTDIFTYDFTHPPGGGADGFVVKLHSNLNINWVKMLGGNDVDGVIGINKGIQKNSMVISASVYSTDSLLGSNGIKGGGDGFAMQIDSTGNEQWSKRYGGTGRDVLMNIFPDTIAKCYYMVGGTASIDGDIQYKTGTIPISAALVVYNLNDWFIKTDSVGNMLYSKAYGVKIDTLIPASYDSRYSDAIWYKGAIWLTSYVQGGGGDFPIDDDSFNYDAWLCKVDTQCNLRGRFILNTKKSDFLNNFFWYDSSAYIYGISSYIGDTNLNWFSCDTAKDFSFVMGISDAPLSNYEFSITNYEWEVYPNPTDGIIKTFPSLLKGEELELYSSAGQLIVKTTKNEIDVNGLPKGNYYLKRLNDKKRYEVKQISIL